MLKIVYLRLYHNPCWPQYSLNTLSRLLSLYQVKCHQQFQVAPILNESKCSINMCHEPLKIWTYSDTFQISKVSRNHINGLCRMKYHIWQIRSNNRIPCQMHIEGFISEALLEWLQSTSMKVNFVNLLNWNINSSKEKIGYWNGEKGGRSVGKKQPLLYG